jgi:integrase
MTTTNSISLRDLSPGKFHTLCKVTPIGSLQARRQRDGGILFFWRYSIGTLSERVKIGVYDPTSPVKKLEPTDAGFSIAAAIRRAEVHALEHHNTRPEGGRPALMKKQREADELAANEAARASNATLTHLLIEYCDNLQRLKRQSHRNARSIFQLHVIDAFPEIAGLPADSVTTEDFVSMIRKVDSAGKGRTANKLRSFARAAYQVAISSKTKSSVPERFREFGIHTNPVAATQPDQSANKADKNPLSVDELRKYWKHIKDLPGPQPAWLRVHLLSGGQRIEQLVRLHTARIHEKQGYFVLFDGKGRPGAGAREHWVPLTTPLQKALRECKPTGEFAFSTCKGVKPIAGTTLSKLAAEIALPHIPGFTAKRIRSGVETALAAAKVSLEARGHLQSHGISGVQARHYDGHDYLDAKREALEQLYLILTRPTPLGRRTSRN